MFESLRSCQLLAWIPGQHAYRQINYAFIFRYPFSVCSKLVKNLSVTIKRNAWIWGPGAIAKNIRNGVTEGPYIDAPRIATLCRGPYLWGQSVYRTYAGVSRYLRLNSLTIVEIAARGGFSESRSIFWGLISLCITLISCNALSPHNGSSSKGRFSTWVLLLLAQKPVERSELRKEG